MAGHRKDQTVRKAKPRTVKAVALAFGFVALSTLAQADAEAAWAALKASGHVIVMRHRLDEPGMGDPPRHRFSVCEIERQLIRDGRHKCKRVDADALCRFNPAPFCWISGSNVRNEA